MTGGVLSSFRGDLELSPSPVAERSGLLIRDPFCYSSSILIISLFLVFCLLLFDGQHTELELREALVRVMADVRVGEILAQLRDALFGGGFFWDQRFEKL